MNKFYATILATLLVAIVQPSISRAGDNTIIVKKPDRNWQTRMQPRLVPGSPSGKTATPFDAAALKESVDQRMRVLFDRALDPSTHLVTAESARRAGVGIISDQFADIDKDQDGKLKFSEVSGFFDARSPIAKPASPSAQAPIAKPVSGEIQIIE
jgi:hypothetical protein